MPLRATPQSPSVPLTTCRERKPVRRLGLREASAAVHLFARPREALRVDAAQLRLGRAAHPLRGGGRGGVDQAGRGRGRQGRGLHGRVPLRHDQGGRAVPQACVEQEAARARGRDRVQVHAV